MKYGEFSVMIGFTVGGKAVVGVVLEPTLGRVTYASQGGGCWAKVGDGPPARCRVSGQADPAAATLVQSRSKPGGKPKIGVTAVGPAKVLETYSAGIKLAMVARGDADLYVNDYPNFHDWDVCAGHVLVEEAGGTVTEFAGDPVEYGSPGKRQRQGMVATNGALHAAVLARLAAHGGR
jgi:3'(2'), 5'-bisphosphate nucleotidase